MLLSTCTASLELVLTYVLPPVGVILSAIAALVALRIRSTYEVERSTLEDHERLFAEVLQRPTRSESRPVAQDRRKRSMKGTTST